MENIPHPRTNYVTSESFWYKKIVLYTRKDSDFKSIQDLYDKPLAAVRGYSYGEYIINNPNLKIQFNHNDDLNLRMLLSGRIDGIIGDDSSTLNAVQSNSQGHLVRYNLDNPIAVLDVFYVCHNSLQGKQLCDDISKVIKQLKQEKIIELNPATGSSQINL